MARRECAQDFPTAVDVALIIHKNRRSLFLSIFYLISHVVTPVCHRLQLFL
jgi:hypothetical protein